MLGYCPDSDHHRHNPEVHYRLYLGRGDRPCVICVKDVDYPRYDESWFLSNEAFNSEQAATNALKLLMLDVVYLAGVRGAPGPTPMRLKDPR